MLGAVSPDERIVCVEDAAELSMCVGFPKVLAAFRPHAGDLVFLGDRRRLEDVRNTMALRWRPGAHQAR